MNISKINFTFLPLFHWYEPVRIYLDPVLAHLSIFDSDSISYIATEMFGRYEKLIKFEKFGAIGLKKQAQTIKGQNPNKIS